MTNRIIWSRPIKYSCPIRMDVVRLAPGCEWRVTGGSRLGLLGRKEGREGCYCSSQSLFRILQTHSCLKIHHANDFRWCISNLEECFFLYNEHKGGRTYDWNIARKRRRGNKGGKKNLCHERGHKKCTKHISKSRANTQVTPARLDSHTAGCP